MTDHSSKLHIGTSGWIYDHWQGPFYPEDTPQEDWLSFYQRRFNSVEINNTFYGLPEKATFQTWREEAPPEFRYAVKANRYITHLKKLQEPQDTLGRFFSAVSELEDTLGPILFQLPPNWGYNHQRLADFLEVLPAGQRYTFELRAPDWINARALDLLADHQAAFCIYDFDGRQSPKEVTADFVYLRLHGPGEAYQGKYSLQALAGWAGAISSWLGKGKDVYCYFDNDQAGYAAENAVQLQEMFSN